MTPTQRTLASLRADGWQVGVLEKWNPHVGPHGIRQDLWGFGDLLACNPESREILLVQATAAGVTERVAKIHKLDAEDRCASNWLASGGQIEVWGWVQRRSKKRLKDGSRAKRMVWCRRRVEVFLDRGALSTRERPEIDEAQIAVADSAF